MNIHNTFFVEKSGKISIYLVLKLDYLEPELKKLHFSYVCKKYSRTSLSRTRLFRITAYLEVKICSCFNMKL